MTTMGTSLVVSRILICAFTSVSPATYRRTLLSFASFWAQLGHGCMPVQACAYKAWRCTWTCARLLPLALDASLSEVRSDSL